MSTIAIATSEAKTRLRGRKDRERQKMLTIILFLVPGFIVFFLFVVWPLVQSAYFSLYNWKGYGAPVDYVALDNYRRILIDGKFQGAMLNGLIIVVLSLVLQLPLSLGLALMVRRALPGRLVFRTIFFLPYVFSEVITGVIWSSMFDADASRGLINALLSIVPGYQSIGWLGESNWVLLCIFVALTWKYFGFHMLLYMAGLSSIQHEIEEAAIVDGANKVQTLFYVTIPLLGNTIRTSVYLSVLGALQQFGLVWIMTKGGPFGASEMMATYMYRIGFMSGLIARGAGVAVITLLICLSFSLVYQFVFRNQDYSSGMYI